MQREGSVEMVEDNNFFVKNTGGEQYKRDTAIFNQIDIIFEQVYTKTIN